MWLTSEQFCSFIQQSSVHQYRHRISLLQSRLIVMPVPRAEVLLSPSSCRIPGSLVHSRAKHYVLSSRLGHGMLWSLLFATNKSFICWQPLPWLCTSLLSTGDLSVEGCMLYPVTYLPQRSPQPCRWHPSLRLCLAGMSASTHVYVYILMLVFHLLTFSPRGF